MKKDHGNNLTHVTDLMYRRDSRDVLVGHYYDETAKIQELSAFKRQKRSTLSQIETVRSNLTEAQQEAHDIGDVKLSTQLGLANIFIDVSARKSTLIDNRHDERYAQAFSDLFVAPSFLQTASLAEGALDYYQTLLDGKPGDRVQMSELIHELTALLISYDPEDPRKFAVPASAFDEQESSGFHFDMILYDLNRPNDFRRAIDIKSRKTKDAEDKISPHARTTFSDEALHNGQKSQIWVGTSYESKGTMPTLRALIDFANGEADSTTVATLNIIRDAFYASQFEGHNKEVHRRLGLQTIKSV